MTEESESVSVIAHRVGELERARDRISDRVHKAEELAGDHEEQINGKRGLSNAVDELAGEIKGLRRAIAGVGVGIILAAVTFAFNVLQH